MKLKTYYKTGHVKVENDKEGFEFYELKDGAHCLPHDSIYRDRDGKRPPIAIFIDGLIAPIGSEQTVELIDQIWNNMDTTKDGGGMPKVSWNWKRSLGELMDALMKFAPILIIAGLIIFALATTEGPLIPKVGI